MLIKSSRCEMANVLNNDIARSISRPTITFTFRLILFEKVTLNLILPAIGSIAPLLFFY